MSIQITITDPTRDEALRLADYLFELAGYGKKDGIVSHERVSHRFETTPAQVADQLKSQIEAMARTPVGEFVDSAGVVHPISALNAGVAPSVPPPPANATIGYGQLTGGSEVDSTGHAWDARIHASSHAVVSDGTWRLRRNLDPKVLEAVLAERAAMLPAETDADVLPPLDPAAPVWPFPSDVPPPPAATVVSGNVPPPPPATGLTFAAFMQRVTAAIGAGTITQMCVATALAEYGVASIPLLASVHTDKIDAIAARLGV